MSAHTSPGDPEGRRLAQRKAILIAEARTIAEALTIVLRRASLKVDDCDAIARQLQQLEALELQKGHGRVEPRRRFKAAPDSYLRTQPRSHLYIDESGKSFPEPKVKNDPAVFVLAGVCLQQEAVDNYRSRADAIKLRFFKDADITFHEPEMRERRGRFKFSDDAEAAIFDEAIDQLIEQTEMTAFGIAIRKKAFQDFMAAETDPYIPTDMYSVAIMMLLERFADCLASAPAPRFGRVFFERQGKKEDAYHQLEYARHLCDGSQWVPPGVFQDWVEPGLTFLPKAGSDPTELADMFSRDLFEWVRDGCTSSPKRWHLFNTKVYRRGDGKSGKFGVKVFPDLDMRELIIEHRQQCGVGN